MQKSSAMRLTIIFFLGHNNNLVFLETQLTAGLALEVIEGFEVRVFGWRGSSRWRRRRRWYSARRSRGLIPCMTIDLWHGSCLRLCLWDWLRDDSFCWSCVGRTRQRHGLWDWATLLLCGLLRELTASALFEELSARDCLAWNTLTLWRRFADRVWRLSRSSMDCTTLVKIISWHLRVLDSLDGRRLARLLVELHCLCDLDLC